MHIPWTAVLLLDAVSYSLESHLDGAMALRGSHVIAILAFFFFNRVVPEPPLISKPKLNRALCAHANLPSPGPGPPISQGNSVKPTNGR